MQRLTRIGYFIPLHSIGPRIFFFFYFLTLIQAFSIRDAIDAYYKRASVP